MAEETQKRPKGGGLAQIVRTSVLIVVVILGALTAWAWLSSDQDEKLPFNYEGFD